MACFMDKLHPEVRPVTHEDALEYNIEYQRTTDIKQYDACPPILIFVDK